MRTTLGNVLLGLTTIAVTTIASLLILTTQYRFEEGLDIEKIALSVVQIGALEEPSTKIRTVGSGIIVTEDGYVLTVKHNILGTQHLYVKTSDGKPFKVLYYVADAHRDLAVLKIELPKKSKLHVAKLGNSEELRAGQTIYTIGYPAPVFMGDDLPTISKGIISVVNRRLDLIPFPDENGEVEAEETVETYGWLVERSDDRGERNPLLITPVPLIQFDAVANPGSSGGALVTENGEVVGLIQSMVTNTGSNVGMNFAIPVNWASLILSGKEATEPR